MIFTCSIQHLFKVSSSGQHFLIATAIKDQFVTQTVQTFNLLWQKSNADVSMFWNLICIKCHRVWNQTKSSLAMADNSTSGKKQSHSAKLELKSQINGLRNAVFSAKGDEYTGEWLKNKKHGDLWLWNNRICYTGLLGFFSNWNDCILHLSFIRKGDSGLEEEWCHLQRRVETRQTRWIRHLHRAPPTNKGVCQKILRPVERREKTCMCFIFCHEHAHTDWNSFQHYYLWSPQGYGMYFYSSCEVYEGDWSGNQRSGWGRMYYECGDIYEGEWVNDKKEGQGIIRYSKKTLLFLI